MSTPKGPHGGLSDFNIHHGFIEALIRGMRCSFLKDADYHHITQCENLEDVKLNLSETDYADAVADMAVLTPSDLQAAAIKKVSMLRCLSETQDVLPTTVGSGHRQNSVSREPIPFRGIKGSQLEVF